MEVRLPRQTGTLRLSATVIRHSLRAKRLPVSIPGVKMLNPDVRLNAGLRPAGMTHQGTRWPRYPVVPLRVPLGGMTALGVLLLLVLLSGALLVGCSGGEPAAQKTPDENTTQVRSNRTTIGEFASGPDMKSRRERFTTVKMSDGRLLAVGGRAVGLQAQSGNYNETAEVFDPAETVWTFTSDMSEQRRSPALFELPDGRVMVAGGLSGQREPLASTEIWDPATGEWSMGPAMNRPHDLMGAVVLPDGRFLMIGGTSKNQDGHLIALNAETEAYDPQTGIWSDVAPMLDERANHTATVLADGRVLVTGGGKLDGPYLKSTEIYDPADDEWTQAAEMSRGRAFHTATLLEDGRVLVVGGKGKIRVAELYDPETDTWSSAGETTDPRSEHSATLLADGTVMVVGGTGYLATSEFFDPLDGSWTTGQSLETGRYKHGAIRLDDGRTLIMGGTSKDGMLATMEIYGGQ